MGSHTLEIKLQQHTPIIHFQHTQAGATLRATEVKPKLDRFLMEKISGSNIPLPKAWLVGKGKAEHVALDYRMGFEAEGSIDYYIEQPKYKNGQLDQKIKNDGKVETRTNPYPLFYGNMAKNYAEPNTIKKFEFAAGGVTMHVFSPNAELLKAIDEAIAEFFATHSFGTRNTKGFGKFFPDPNHKQQGEKYKLTSVQHAFDYQFEIAISQQQIQTKRNSLRLSDDIEAEFFCLNERINWFYRSLRSGINEVEPDFIYKNGERIIKDDEFGLPRVIRHFYFKSLIFKYFISQDPSVQWEKKTIKENFFADQLVKQQNRLPDSEALNEGGEKKLLVKDLLGLSSTEAWLSYGANLSKVQGENGKELDKERINIHRFASPIRFHVFKKTDGKGYQIFIKFDKTASLTGKEFVIKRGRDPLPLNTPDQFDLDDFFAKTVMDVRNNFAQYAQNYGTAKGNELNNGLSAIYQSLQKIQKQP
jgi:hypothetical protein